MPEAGSVLVKGSRFMGMEKIVQALLQAAGALQEEAMSGTQQQEHTKHMEQTQRAERIERTEHMEGAPERKTPCC